MLWWMDAGSLGQTEQEDEKEEWTFMWESSWSALSSAQGWVRGQLKSCRWRLAVQITCSVAVGRVAVELLTRKTVGEAFFRLLEEASHFQAPLMGDFKHSYICCRNNTEGQSWRLNNLGDFLDLINDKFLAWVIEDPTRKSALLDLIQARKNCSWMWKSVTIKWWHSWSYKEGAGPRDRHQPRISGEQPLFSSGICLAESHGMHPWRGVQENWIDFLAQERSILTSRQSSKDSSKKSVGPLWIR